MNYARTVVNTAWASAMVSSMITNLPFLWFVISMAFWGLLAFALFKLFKHYDYQSQVQFFSSEGRQDFVVQNVEIHLPCDEQEWGCVLISLSTLSVL